MLCQGPSERLESSSVSVWATVRNRLRRGVGLLLAVQQGLDELCTETSGKK